MSFQFSLGTALVLPEAVMLLSCAVNFSSGFGGSAFSWASAASCWKKLRQIPVSERYDVAEPIQLKTRHDFSKEVMTLSQDIATCVQDAPWCKRRQRKS